MEHILKNHNLKHIDELKVSRNIFIYRFSTQCSMSGCKGYCCKWGVFVDILEQEKILYYADIVKKYMEYNQEHDHDNWFEGWIIDDSDFPSGKAVGTQALPYGCVFLDSKGQCTLQKACIGEGLNPLKLKPFYCIVFPLTIDKGTLMIDDTEIDDQHNCPMISESGSATIFDVCDMELEFMLGREGKEELEKLYKIYLENPNIL